MSAAGDRAEPGHGSQDRLAEILGADEMMRPRPEFRAAVRQRLMAQPAAAPRWRLAWPTPGRLAVPSLPALVAILLIVTGTVLAAALILSPGLRLGPFEWRTPVSEDVVGQPPEPPGPLEPPAMLPAATPLRASATNAAGAGSDAVVPSPLSSPARPSLPARPAAPVQAPGLVPEQSPAPATEPSAGSRPGAGASPDEPNPVPPTQRSTEPPVVTAEPPPSSTAVQGEPLPLPATPTPEPTETGLPTTTPYPTTTPTPTTTVGAGRAP